MAGAFGPWFLNGFQPGLLPGMADLLQASRFAAVLALTCGLGRLAGARRPETALFTGWGIACLVFVAAGCLTRLDLAVPASLLALAGAAGLLEALRPRPAAGTGMAWRVLALAAPLLLILLSLRSIAFDDFSFWAPNLIGLCLTGHFPAAARPLAASFMPGYPRGVALAGYATWLLGPDPSPAGLLRLLATGAWWNMLLLLAAAAALAENLAARLPGKRLAGRTAWGLAAASMLLLTFLDPGFIPKMTLSEMGDGGTAAGLAMLTALLFELPDAEKPGRILREMAATATATSFIRQDNPALLGIWAAGLALGLLRHPGRCRHLAILAAAALPALLTTAIWTRYVAGQIPGGAHRLLPFAQWHWAEFPATLHAAGRVLLEKSVYTLLAIGFAAGLAMRLRRGGRAGPAPLLPATTALVWGNAGFILFTYLATSFTPVETRTAVTFWRFLAQTAPAEMVALACLLPWPRLAIAASRSAAPALCLIAALLPVVLLPTPFTLRGDLRFDAPAFLELGQSLGGLLPPGARLLLLDNSDGSGYVAWMIRFGLLDLAQARNPVILSLAPQLQPGAPPDPRLLAAADYLLVTQGPWRPPYLPGQTLQPWHAYLFRRGPAGAVLLRTWPIPPYGRKY